VAELVHAPSAGSLVLCATALTALGLVWASDSRSAGDVSEHQGDAELSRRRALNLEE
jgi:hypothetical protein